MGELRSFIRSRYFRTESKTTLTCPIFTPGISGYLLSATASNTSVQIVGLIPKLGNGLGIRTPSLPWTITKSPSRRNTQAQSGKKVEYTLTMQRSTKRFTENFNVVGDAKASFENSGRCVETNPMPTLPDPPPLTEEQKDAQEKREFCADFSNLSDPDKGYCNAPFVYIDD